MCIGLETSAYGSTDIGRRVGGGLADGCCEGGQVRFQVVRVIHDENVF